MESRFVVWTIFFEKMASPARVVFGYGYGIGNYYLLGYTTGANLTMYIHNSFHNGFLQVLSDGGILVFTSYIGILVFSLKNIIQLRNKSIKILLLSFLIAFILYSFSESLSLFSSAYESIMFGFIIITIPLVLNKMGNPLEKKPNKINCDILEITI